jgi:hypothetical protein
MWGGAERDEERMGWEREEKNEKKKMKKEKRKETFFWIESISRLHD